MRWRNTQVANDERVRQLSKDLGVKEEFPLPLSNILVQRGVDDLKKAKLFFRPDLGEYHDPLQMKGMREAVTRLAVALQKGQKVLLYGDYDVDGTTSVSVMHLFLKDWGFDIEYYIPDRYAEGYGISYKGVEYAADTGVKLFIALDCGTKAIDKIRFGVNKGIDFIVVDHHRPGDELPPVAALINPKQKGCQYPYKELSACGLALKYCSALETELHRIFPDRGQALQGSAFQRYCDLATLSIAADIVPITGENRMIAYYGLKKIQQSPNPGIAAMQKTSEYERKWDISDLVFFIGPRINSAGRLGSARNAVRVLIGDQTSIREHALALQDYNDRRKKLDSGVTESALERIQQDPAFSEKKSTVLYDKSWSKGIIGIVASRLIETYYRPTVLLTWSDPYWVGSGRSVEGFDLYDTLDACSDHLVQFGGHTYAAGLTLKDEDLEGFADAFEREVARRIQPQQLEPVLEIGYELDFTYINPRFVRLYRRMAPFGPGNMEPVLVTRKVKITDCRILKVDHVRFCLEESGRSFEAIGFGLAHKWKELNSTYLDVAYQPDFKTWKGNTSIQLKIKDIRTPA